MIISELESQLRQARERYGDIPVNINLEYLHVEATKVQPYIEYNDSDYKFYEQNNPNEVAHWVSIQSDSKYLSEILSEY